MVVVVLLMVTVWLEVVLEKRSSASPSFLLLLDRCVCRPLVCLGLGAEEAVEVR